METQALAVMRKYTDECCNRLGMARVDIGLINDAGVWSACDANSKRITHAWRLVMAPAYVCEFVAAREVARLAGSRRGRNLGAVTQKSCPVMDKAEAWLANGPGLLRFGRA